MAKKRHHRVLALAAIAEHMAKNIKGRKENSTALRMLAEVNRLRLGAEALDNVRASRSPLDTPQAHALKVARLAKKFDGEVTAAINRYGSIASEGRGDIQRRIGEKIDFKPDTFAQEIRTAFRSLDQQGKTKLLGELVAQNRGPELAAIVKAPPLLSGISAADQANFEKAIISKHAPDELEEQEWLNEIFVNCMTAASAAYSLGTEMQSPSEIAAIERAASEADAASQSFYQSMQ